MAAAPNAGGSPCNLTPGATNNVQCDYHCPTGRVSFTVAIYSGGGTVAFAALNLDGHDQPITNPLTANLTAGQHALVFTLAFSDPTATAVIREACDAPKDLILVNATSPYERLRICVP
jgi:hypothetical protein